jgi:hypothetical protein
MNLGIPVRSAKITSKVPAAAIVNNNEKNKAVGV